MKKQSIVFIAIIFSITAGALIGKLSYSPAITINPESANIQETDNAQWSEQVEEKYLLKDHNGKLAIFIVGKDKPEIIFQVFTDNLPDIDKFKLTEGIYAKNYNDLMKMVEDYTS